MTKIIITVILLFQITLISTEKILIFHHVASYSHRVQTYPLAQALAERGHEVHYISPFYPKQPNKNISELVPQKMAQYVDEFLNKEFDINLRVENNIDWLIEDVFVLGYGACEALFNSEEFKPWLKLNPKFDLVIVDNCLAECGVGLAHKLGAKHIIFSTVAVIAHEYDAYGFMSQSFAVPELEAGSGTKIPPFGFLERVYNAILPLWWRWEHYQYQGKVDSLIRKELETPDMPQIDELVRNTSLIFTTGDVITDYPRSLPPLHINVAGIHCQEAKNALPKEIETFVQNDTVAGNDGFIYISLGSLVISSNLPDNIKQIFYEAIKAFPNVKFLWKWNGDFPKVKPDNLLLQKWFPQNDVLGHPMIKGFITQLGRPSCLEALFHGVPMISFPILGDQDLNANRLSQMGAALKLEIGTVTVDQLKEAISTVLYDSGFKAKVKKYQRIFRDRPMTPVETATWYTEYVLRHEDTLHLKPAGSEDYWFIRRQIDVWGFLSIGLFLIVVGIFKFIRKTLTGYFRVEDKLKKV